MLWVIEGVDRTGKTTLCTALKLLYGGEVMHFGKPEQSAIDEYVSPLLTYDPRSGTNVFVDRHFLGEAVWPQFFDRPPRMTPAERYCIELFLQSKGALCVLAWRDPADLEMACTIDEEPPAGRAAEAQTMFMEQAREFTSAPLLERDRTRLLHWYGYHLGDDVTHLVERARDLERQAP